MSTTETSFSHGSWVGREAVECEDSDRMLTASGFLLSPFASAGTVYTEETQDRNYPGHSSARWGLNLP